MHWSRKYVIVGGSVLALAAGGAGTAIATSDDDEGGATGPGADQAKAAALKITRAATPTRSSATRRTAPPGRSRSTKPDGSTVDVRLDQNYQLVVVEGDSEDQGGN